MRVVTRFEQVGEGTTARRVSFATPPTAGASKTIHRMSEI